MVMTAKIRSNDRRLILAKPKLADLRKKRGTRSRFMVWLRVLWSLIEAEAEGVDLDLRGNPRDQDDHAVEDQESLLVGSSLNVTHRGIQDDGHEDQRDDDHQGLRAGKRGEGR